MDVSKFEIRDNALYNITNIRAHELRILLEGLMLLRADVNEKISLDDEQTITLDRFIDKSFQSKNVRKCLFVRNNIDGLIELIQNAHHVPASKN